MLAAGTCTMNQRFYNQQWKTAYAYRYVPQNIVVPNTTVVERFHFLTVFTGFQKFAVVCLRY